MFSPLCVILVINSKPLNLFADYGGICSTILIESRWKIVFCYKKTDSGPLFLLEKLFYYNLFLIQITSGCNLKHSCVARLLTVTTVLAIFQAITTPPSL